MTRAVKAGFRLTRQLLSFSRKQALRPETVELQQWLPATEGLVKSTLGSKIVLDFHVDPDTRPITVDLAELELALINTALNAQFAMPDGGTLRVAASNTRHARSGDRPMVVICVEDDGSGISPDLLPRVFEPFFTTKSAGQGSGLGLSQVAGLCDQAGGFATVESDEGKGTKIGLSFPAATAPVVEGEVLPGQPQPALRGCVLLVEDNDEVAAVTESLLTAAGLVVVGVANAEAALERIGASAGRFDVVVSDISMPGPVDGIGLAFAVRKNWPWMPVLADDRLRRADRLGGGRRPQRAVEAGTAARDPGRNPAPAAGRDAQRRAGVTHVATTDPTPSVSGSAPRPGRSDRGGIRWRR